MFELFFLGCFFTFWNYLIGRFTVAAFTRLFREGCGSHICILLWPHWIVGISFPLLIGMSTYRPFTAMLLIAVTCVLPYTYWIIRLNCGADDENDNYRTMPCCSCLCKDFHRTNLEKSIICKRVVDGGYDDDDEDDKDDEELGYIGKNDSLRFQSAREEESIVSYRAKHPKSDIVKKRKKQTKKNTKTNNAVTDTKAKTNINSTNEDDNGHGGAVAMGCNDSDNDNDSNDTKTKNGGTHDNDGALSNQQGLSFPVALPDDNDDNDDDDNNNNYLHDEETPCIRGIEEDENENENSISNTDDIDDGISQSELMCSICLEEYSVGDEIAWSKNDECHHAFHKDCIIEWLVNHQNCPICRKKY